MSAVDDTYIKSLATFSQACSTVLLDAGTSGPARCRQLLRDSISGVKREGSKLIASLPNDQADTVRRSLAITLTTNREIERALTAWANGDRSAFNTLAKRFFDDASKPDQQRQDQRDQARRADEAKRQHDQEQRERAEREQRGRERQANRRPTKSKQPTEPTLKVRLVAFVIMAAAMIILNEGLNVSRYIAFPGVWMVGFLVCHRIGIEL